MRYGRGHWIAFGWKGCRGWVLSPVVVVVVVVVVVLVVVVVVVGMWSLWKAFYLLLEGKLMHRKTKRQITESKHVQAQQIHRHRTAGTFFFSLLADAEHGSSHLAGKKIFFHLPCAQFPCAQPKIFIAMPILILGGSHFGTQARRPYLGVLIQNNPILQESPGSVDDLGQRKGEEAGVPIIRRQLRSWHGAANGLTKRAAWSWQ